MPEVDRAVELVADNVLAPFRSKRFEVIARLGAGGMGVVYEALDRERGARVALKTIRDPQAGSLLRFKNEFRALHDIRHPNLISLGELHEEDGAWFFTMELIDGTDFLRWVRGGKARGFIDSGTVSPEHRLRFETPISHVTNARTVVGESAEQIASSPTLVALSSDKTSSDESVALPSDGPSAASPEDGSASVIGLPPPTMRADSAGHPRVPFDEARLRDGLRQLARGLHALHQAKRIHRDIKPSNLLVSREGRVVLLDFGLVSHLKSSGSTNVEVVGTAEYMAPEQASARHIGAEADWYSVGVLLFEVMVGRFPFEGSAIQVLSDKQQRDAPRASSFIADLPSDLDRLCADLLARDPAARPAGEELLARLADGLLETSGTKLVTAEPVSEDDPFVGREREREALHEAAMPAFDPELAQPVAVTLEGESGVGKSALLARFLGEVTQRSPEALVLRGRCYERESVTFKAFDGIIDALATHLRSLRAVEAAGLVPRYAALLLEAFPVLGIVPAIAQAPMPRAAVSSPGERRNRLFDAMRELFQRLRAVSPVVLAIDDVQWADRDSLLLLQEIVRQPEGPPLLVVGTARPLAGASEAYPHTSARSGLASLGVKTHLLRIGRLPVDEARALAVRLLAARSSSRPHGSAPLDLDAIVRESGGHPLFIDALVRHACSEGAPSGSG
ncbi:MAG: serine/threonine-protein kinase PknK, partial [Polyangiales bacterium]